MLDFGDLLTKATIDGDHVNIARHRPEPALEPRFPWIASERPELFDYYQATQSPQREAMLLKRDYLASFIGLKDGTTIFVGLYRKIGHRPISRDLFQADPRFLMLRELGCGEFKEAYRLLFDFVELEEFKPLKGRLFIRWSGGERSFIQVAGRRPFPIVSLAESNQLVGQLKKPRELLLSLTDIRALPRSWRERISQWRAIYLVTDVTDGARYVGSAYGAENLLQRWENYASKGHGGNKLLKDRNPSNFRFSVLEVLGMTEDKEEVISKESSWKERLLTRVADWHFGLNEN